MRIKRLDGVRAVAAVLVILYQNSFVDLGWTGVELFFVLSGFLMTRILRGSRADASYWSRFYVKRAVRIVPLLLLILVAGRLATNHVRSAAIAGYALFLGNFVDVLGYGVNILSILWALAVGAQFVLLWSVAVRFLTRRWLMAITISMLVIEPLARSLATPHLHSSEAFALTWFHLDSMAAGSLLALLLEGGQLPSYLARLSGWASAAIAVGFLGVSYEYPWFIRITMAPVYNSLAYWSLSWMYFFFVAWVLCAREGGMLDRAFSWRPVLFVAEISYGLALVHPFVIAILKRVLHLPFGLAGEPTNRKIFPLAIVISVPICAMLFRLVQRPVHVWGEKLADGLRAKLGDRPKSEEEMVAAR